MPKPDGTDGAANNDAANLKLLKTFSDELSTMNTAWQKAANSELLNGQTVEDFDTFSQRIEKEKGATATISTDDQAGRGDAEKGQSQNGDTHHKQHDTAASSSNDDGKGSQSQQEQQPAPQKSQPKKEEKQAPQEKSRPQTPQKPEEQPKTQPQHKEQPQPKDEPQPQPKEEPKAKAKPSGGSGVTAKYSGQMFAGSMTYYDVGLDACGNTDKKSDFIVAVAPEWFDEFSGGDSNPNHNKLCGQTINISKNGKSTQAKVFDICPGCDRLHIDMSEDLFKFFEDLAVGECEVSWGFA